MLISQKCQYALRALFELAKSPGDQPVKIAAVAKSQEIPPRFLEAILNQLRQGGFVASRRGNMGGYVLVRPPTELTVGDVVRFMEGPIGPVYCVIQGAGSSCALRAHCVFFPLWKRVQEALESIYDTTTFQDLLDQEERQRPGYVPSFSI